MSASAFLVLANGIKAALTVPPSVAGVPVYINRTRPAAATEARAIFVRLVASRIERQASVLGAHDWTTLVEITLGQRVSSQDNALAGIDEFFQACWGALLGQPLAIPDVTEIDAEPDIKWEDDPADQTVATVTFRLVVQHRTKPDNLTPWSA